MLTARMVRTHKMKKEEYVKNDNPKECRFVITLDKNTLARICDKHPVCVTLDKNK